MTGVTGAVVAWLAGAEPGLVRPGPSSCRWARASAGSRRSLLDPVAERGCIPVADAQLAAVRSGCPRDRVAPVPGRVCPRPVLDRPARRVGVMAATVPGPCREGADARLAVRPRPAARGLGRVSGPRRLVERGHGFVER